MAIKASFYITIPKTNDMWQTKIDLPKNKISHSLLHSTHHSCSFVCIPKNLDLHLLPIRRPKANKIRFFQGRADHHQGIRFYARKCRPFLFLAPLCITTKSPPSQVPTLIKAGLLVGFLLSFNSCRSNNSLAPSVITHFGEYHVHSWIAEK